jgi:hypothetical protein
MPPQIVAPIPAKPAPAPATAAVAPPAIPATDPDAKPTALAIYGAPRMAPPTAATPAIADLTGLFLTASLILVNRPAWALVPTAVISMITAKVVASILRKLRFNLIIFLLQGSGNNFFPSLILPPFEMFWN